MLTNLVSQTSVNIEMRLKRIYSLHRKISSAGNAKRKDSWHN